MLRAALLIFENEFRLLARDKVGLFMLLLAPVVIIAVAGFSLGSLYGPRTGTHEYLVAVVNDDHGTVGAATIDARNVRTHLGALYQIAAMMRHAKPHESRHAVP